MAATITSAPASTSASTITVSPNSVYTIPTTSLPAFACDEGYMIETAPEPNAVGLEPLYNVTFNWLENCCSGAPIVAYQDGCSGYCTAQNQNVNRLYSCLQTSLSAATDVAPFFMVCNGCSQSSTLGIASATGSLTTTAASGSSTASQSPNVAATGVGDGMGGVGKMALALMSILVASLFARATML